MFCRSLCDPRSCAQLPNTLLRALSSVGSGAGWAPCECLEKALLNDHRLPFVASVHTSTFRNALVDCHGGNHSSFSFLLRASRTSESLVQCLVLASKRPPTLVYLRPWLALAYC